MQDNGLNLALQSAGKDWLVSNLLLQRQSYWVHCLVLCKRQGAALSIRHSSLTRWQGRGTISARTVSPFLLHEHHSTIRIIQHALAVAALAFTRSPFNVGKWAVKSPLLIRASACYLSHLPFTYLEIESCIAYNMKNMHKCIPRLVLLHWKN